MKISFYTLGCKVNQYETEMLKERFLAAGHEIVGEQEYANAYIINTCTVTSLADRKSRQHIRKMKKLNQDSIVAVTGCYAQTNPSEVCQIEGVDIIIGTNKKGRLVELVEKTFEEKNQKFVDVSPYEDLIDYEETGIITSMESRTRAYIKVQEGCDRFCSYCIIPYARGKVRSRAPKDIFLEAKSLIDRGFKELILTGINTALYGGEKGFCADLPQGFTELSSQIGEGKVSGIEIIIAMLETLDGDFRIRIGSLEPTVINKDYVVSLLKYKKLCHHLHLSIQSGSDKVLGDMNRHYTSQDYLDIVKVLREYDPYYGISTDIIVGFPGESEADFAESLKMTRLCDFCKVHAFKYSKRQGTRAATMKNHIAPEIKKARSEKLIFEGENSSRRFFESCEGIVRKVLIEEYDEKREAYTGYTDSYIKVYIKLGQKAGQKTERKSDQGRDSKVNNIQGELAGFVDVILGKPFLDGVNGTLVKPSGC